MCHLPRHLGFWSPETRVQAVVTLPMWDAMHVHYPASLPDGGHRVQGHDTRPESCPGTRGHGAVCGPVRTGRLGTQDLMLPCNQACDGPLQQALTPPPSDGVGGGAGHPL